MRQSRCSQGDADGGYCLQSEEVYEVHAQVYCQPGHNPKGGLVIGFWGHFSGLWRAFSQLRRVDNGRKSHSPIQPLKIDVGSGVVQQPRTFV